MSIIISLKNYHKKLLVKRINKLEKNSAFYLNAYRDCERKADTFRTFHFLSKKPATKDYRRYINNQYYNHFEKMQYYKDRANHFYRKYEKSVSKLKVLKEKLENS